MSKSQFIKLSGWAFILGSFGFITLLGDSDPIAFAGSVISSILLAIGVLGLRARYGEHAGAFGRNILLLDVIGMILLYVVLVILYFGVVVLSVIQIDADKGLWILMFGGPAVVLLGLTLFGFAALRNKPMARLNWLPVVAGIWYPVIYFFLAGYLFTHDGAYPAQYQNAINVMLLLQFFALCVFGAILVTDRPQEMATA